MKPKKLTRAKKRQAIYAHNQQSILQRKVLTENQYNDLFLDSGRKFLETLYPEDDQKYQKLFNHFYGCRNFWKWWLKKWKDWENQLLIDVESCEVPLNDEVYKESMLPIIYDYRTETNFLDYIKLLHYAL
ncbi:MAG: hypothetical protein N4A35_05275 [Flavobacteriales bacterium]|jgi:hypothetical protein|nr:hypothetical protein [Flavobacteriales bacterium]